MRHGTIATAISLALIASAAAGQVASPAAVPRPIYVRSNQETPQNLYDTIRDYQTRRILPARYRKIFVAINKYLGLTDQAAEMNRRLPADAIVVLPDPNQPNAVFGWFSCDQTAAVVKAAKLRIDEQLYYINTLRDREESIHSV